MNDAPVPDGIEDLRKDASELFLVEFWQEVADLELAKPRERAVPYRWRWTDLYAPLMRAAEIVPLEQSERRALLFANPSMFPKPYMTTTIYGAVSLYNPGETATVHRHTPNASRFVLQGAGGFTTVEGERCDMARGDLIVTPAGTWHDHGNDGTEPVIWFDVLDLPLVEWLNSTFFEFDYQDQGSLSNSDEPAKKATQSITAPPDHSHNLYAAGGIVPTFLAHDRAGSGRTPMYVYRWADTLAALDRMRSYDASPYDGVLLEYVNPATGEPVTPTLSFFAQLLRPGEHTRAHRHTASTVYCVLEGQGATVLDDTRLAWERNDVFVVPSWRWHEHVNLDPRNDAVLYAVSDAATLRKLALYREEGKTSEGDVVTIER